jgi:predicted 3-demethylubiquinone-9 3-methyltransferase (glyoxalase superfamily)
MADRFQRITPFLWFNNDAEDAVKFYVSVFKNSRIGQITHYTKESADASGQSEGTVMTIAFELDGQPFTAINGGPHFKFTEAVSFVVDCKTQKEIDTYWERLLEGGEESQCGWLKDRYGLSWQIIPTRLTELIGDPDPERANRAMQAMLQMRKIDVAEIERAADAG